MQMHATILRMALPLVANLLLDVLVVYTDFFMVAKLGSNAIAAVGMGGQIWMLFYAMLPLFYAGQSALIGRFTGAGLQKRASMALSTILLFGTAAALPLLFLWHYLGSAIYGWFQTPEAVLTLSVAYTTILAYVVPAMLLNAIFTTALNSYGNMRTGLMINIGVVLLNALLDYLLIFGHSGFPALGVEGAAIATVISEIASLCIFIYLYLRRKIYYSPMRYFNPKLLRRMLKVGFPAMAERLLSSGSYLLFTGMILSLGTEVYAGFQIGFRIEGLAFMPGIAFAIVASVLIAQELGAGRIERATRAVRLSLGYAVTVMFILSLTFMLIPEKLGGFFTDDTNVLQHAAWYLLIVGTSQIPLAIHFVLQKALGGAGDTKGVFRLTITSMWLIRIVPAAIAVYIFHSETGVYLAMITDTFVKSLLLWRRFHQGAWQKLRV